MTTRQGVTVMVYHDTKERMAPVLAAGRALRAALEEDDRWIGRFDRKELPSQERLELRLALHEHIRQLRLNGDLLDTVDTIVEYGARKALAERGWDKKWRPAPAQARLPGRGPGSRVAGAPVKITVRLDSALVEQVASACWWTSASSIGKLRTFRDDNPGLLFDTDLDRYEEIARDITTVGDLYRQGLRLVLPRAVPASPNP